ncbi:hypothetical protein [Hungatella sp.]|uniref:hypothetical protein n=1 Tax=Hungatella sp. TaxID=2613924 RepID=UPI003AB58E5F
MTTNTLHLDRLRHMAAWKWKQRRLMDRESYGWWMAGNFMETSCLRLLIFVPICLLLTVIYSPGSRAALKA